MSWSISVTGTKEAVLEKVRTELTTTAESYYQGSEEHNDIIAVRDRACALIEALELGPDQYGSNWNAVQVEASGSHSVHDQKVLSANLSLKVVRTTLAL